MEQEFDLSGLQTTEFKLQHARDIAMHALVAERLYCRQQLVSEGVARLGIPDHYSAETFDGDAVDDMIRAIAKRCGAVTTLIDITIAFGDEGLPPGTERDVEAMRGVIACAVAQAFVRGSGVKGRKTKKALYEKAAERAYDALSV